MSEQPIPPADVLQKNAEKETLAPRIEKVVFGHWARDFDLDQASTIFLANRARMYNGKAQQLTDVPLLSPDVSYEFAPVPSQNELDNTAALVIEGIPKQETKKNTAASANFDNYVRDDKEFPAADAFAQAFNRELGGPDAGKVADFRAWLRAHESKQPFTGTLKNLTTHNLQIASDLFEAIKHSLYRTKDTNPDYKKQLVTEAVTLFEKVFAAGQTPLEQFDPAGFAEYQKALTALNQHEATYQAPLEARAKEPGALQFTRVTSQDPMNGAVESHQIAYFDIRGLNIPKGGNTKMLEKARALGYEPELIMLIDDELDDEDHVVGTKMIVRPIQIEGTTQASPINLNDISQRLHRSEKLLGKGYDFISQSDYGGHTFLLSTPRGGSALDRTTFWGGMQEYIMHKHYTDSEWKTVVQELAHRAGCNTFDPELPMLATEANLAKRQALFRVQTTAGETREIILSEDDLPYYAAVFAQQTGEPDPQRNAAILSRKTPTDEAPEVSQLKLLRAQERLTHELAEGTGLGLLYSLHTIDAEALERMPLATRMNILEKISADPAAVAAVWDKDDTRFGIPNSDLREWLAPGSEAYKKATYDFSTSVSKKIDRHLVDSIYEQLTTDKNIPELEKYSQLLVDVLASPAYQESHREQSYDHLLQAALRMVADDKLPQTMRTQVAERIAQKYHASATHWNRVAATDRTLLNRAATESSAIQSVLTALGVDTGIRRNAALPTAEIVDPQPEKTKAHLERQKTGETGAQPYLTVFVEIGRPIRDLIARKGIVKLEKDDQSRFRTEEDIEFDAELSLAGSMLQTERDGPQATRIADEVVSMIRNLHEQAPDAQIRVVRGGFSNFLSSRLTERILRRGNFSEDVLKKIVYCDWDIQKKQYYDYPMLSEDETEETATP